MESIVYNIPSARIAEYRGRKVIVRVGESSETTDRISRQEPDNLVYFQLHSLDRNQSSWLGLKEGVPIDLVLQNPEMDLASLYRYAALVETHPVRVSIPVVPGFGKAVKLAVALNFAVKLEGSQPEAHLIREMIEVADLYLHQSTVSAPVDYFHSLFFAFYQGKPLNLWDVQEEDPAFSRYIDDNGSETISGRFVGKDLGTPVDSFLEKLRERLQASGSECSGCEFFNCCGGYFKWPDGDYPCEGIKALFGILKSAAEELKGDLYGLEHAEQGDRR